ncbi:MAG TPA: tRNA 2-selenouridine(34) synthase MnmH [Spirochaetota bacterium]|nr:tRNA 2-selenouridine(34) synthase MnmH [Spirochaetota bacterium]HPS85733.1 tRNA 2-selenouridine(34) synthase MnmH [Spirochaetota bacterium]
MEDITFEESLKIANPLYVDVRAPIEYNEDHIPGAINLPIFNDEERKEVGTLYKMVGRVDAVKRGTEIGGKRIVDIINSLTEIKDRQIIIYCARGGMRSGAVASLISSLGIKTYRIIDGYRSFRKIVMDELSTVEIKPKIFILQGLTGAGKTEILKLLPNSVDLEGMAGHRSSMFGGIGLKQNSQKCFETLLWLKLEELKNEAFIVFEGESKKVGNMHIPENIFRQMREAPAIYIETSIERRVEIIRREYTGFDEDEKILKIANSLRSKLGSKKTDELIEFYKQGNLDEFIKILLLDYYDTLYRHTLDKFDYLARINNTDTVDASEKVLLTIKRVLNL